MHSRSSIDMRRGQALVEFALALPILLLCLFGTLDLGRAVYAQFTLSSAVREGARRAVILTVPDADVKLIVAQKAIGLNLGSGDVSMTGARSPGSLVTVSATYIFRPVTPIISSIAGAWMQLQAWSSMVVE